MLAACSPLPPLPFDESSHQNILIVTVILFLILKKSKTIKAKQN
jgi:hypothetical protein